MTYIGIDPGVHTGFAVWHSDTKYLAEVSTMTITQAMERVKMIADIRGKDNIRLFIEDARRSSAGGEKCRCDKAYVAEIQNADGTKADIEAIHSNRGNNFVYAVGATVEVPDFDDDRWNECAPGIHFFIDRLAAVEY